MFPISDPTRRLFPAAAAAVAIACLTGCMPVLSERPAGDVAYEVDSFWEGIWIPQNEVNADPLSVSFQNTRSVSVRIKAAATGELELAWLEQDGKQIEMRKESMRIQRADAMLLASIPYSALFKRGSAEGQTPLYAWARIERIASNRIAISAPSIEGFHKRLGDGIRVVDKAGSNHPVAIVTHVSGEILRLLQAGDEAWAPAVIYRRLSPPEDYPLRIPAEAVDKTDAPAKAD